MTAWRCSPSLHFSQTTCEKCRKSEYRNPKPETNGKTAERQIRDRLRASEASPQTDEADTQFRISESGFGRPRQRPTAPAEDCGAPSSSVIVARSRQPNLSTNDYGRRLRVTITADDNDEATDIGRRRRPRLPQPVRPLRSSDWVAGEARFVYLPAWEAARCE